MNRKIRAIEGVILLVQCSFSHLNEADSQEDGGLVELFLKMMKQRHHNGLVQVDYPSSLAGRALARMAPPIQGRQTDLTELLEHVRGALNEHRERRGEGGTDGLLTVFSVPNLSPRKFLNRA